MAAEAFGRAKNYGSLSPLDGNGYLEDTHFRWKIKWRLKHLGALRIMGDGPFKDHSLSLSLVHQTSDDVTGTDGR